jgi:hypothetical protein
VNASETALHGGPKKQEVGKEWISYDAGIYQWVNSIELETVATF